jgi:uncharacterized tellurite resistance protein B-like protein|tara:strand:+ start:99 stop:521 length:423 start_codon:yes stop_codon:yes gene_type:complete
MFKSKKKNKSEESNDLLLYTASLLIHASKIDENYTVKEKDIIKKTLIDLGAESSKINDILINAEKLDSDSNHILNFTQKIKNSDKEYKIKIIETLWNIIYSDGQSDMYEDNLMRRLTGLLYLDNKTVGSIKERIQKNLKK